MARCGVGEFVLIDPDVVTESNLATQQAYRRDIGRPKVECLRERILDINPQAIVRALPKLLDDVSDTEFEDLATEPRRCFQRTEKLWGYLDVEAQVSITPAVTLLCGLTDQFERRCA